MKLAKFRASLTLGLSRCFDNAESVVILFKHEFTFMRNIKKATTLERTSQDKLKNYLKFLVIPPLLLQCLF